MRILVLWIVCWLTIGIENTYAQWQLQIEGPLPESPVVKSYLPSGEYQSKVAAQQAVEHLIESLQQAGYFHASAQPLPISDTLVYRAQIRPGQPFQWAYLSPGNLDPILQVKSGFRESLFLNAPFCYSDFQQLVSNCLDYSEDQGFPFASLRLKNIKIEDSEVSATLDYQSGPFIRFGELNIQGTDRVNPEFLEAYLGIRTGATYRESKVAQIANRLRLLSFLSLDGPIETRFQNEVADIYLPLKAHPTNQVDGILSVLPDAGRGDKKILLTGEMNILLRNLGQTGKTFDFHWQRLQVASQQLSLAYDHPNLLRSAFGVGIEFELLKEDTLFLNRKVNLRLSRMSGKNHRFSFFGDWRTSRITGENSGFLSDSQPDLANVTLRGGGFQYQWSRVDWQLFPRQGYSLSVAGRSGSKSVSYWVNEPGQNETITLKTDQGSQWAGELSFNQYYMLGSFLGIYHRLQGRGLLDKNLFVNELYRLGGLNSLRGFTDNQFFVSHYALSNLEIRWFLESENPIPSYIFAFYDQAWMQPHYQKHPNVEVPLGIGAGLSVSTSAGLFSLAYAVGKSRHQIMSLSSSKVHFGYISRF